MEVSTLQRAAECCAVLRGASHVAIGNTVANASSRGLRAHGRLAERFDARRQRGCAGFGLNQGVQFHVPRVHAVVLLLLQGAEIAARIQLLHILQQLLSLNQVL